MSSLDGASADLSRLPEVPVNDGAQVSSIGEFALIERLRRFLGASSAVVGIGDDAAVIDQVGPEYLLATVDMLIDGVHFRLADDASQSIGRRAIGCNASDIAAMGGRPTFALVSLALPPALESRTIMGVYEGMREVATQLGIGIVGGNVAKTSGPLCIDVTLLGQVLKNDVVLRSGAKPGDLLAVTGTLGNATAVRLVRELPLQSRAEWQGFVDAHAYPHPRLAAGQALAREHLAHALIDISDGLLGDLRHLADASAVGILLDEVAVPTAAEMVQIATAIGLSPAGLATRGGEDYELLLALDPADFSPAQRIVAPLTLTLVGTVTERSDGLLMTRADGTVVPLPDGGWTHF